MQSGLTLWCNRLIKTGFYLLFGLVPLLLTPWNYELFEYNKMMAVYAITALVVTAWLVKMIKQGELRIAKTPLDIPILLFTASQLVSTLFSIDPHVSWFGYYSRFNGGMLSIISYVLLYYALVSNAALFSKSTALRDITQIDTKSAKNKQKQKQAAPTITTIFVLLKAGLATAVLVAFYGVLERLGIDKHLWVQDVQNRVFSTLGQPNWLAAYLTAFVPVAWALGLNNVTIQQNNKMTNKAWLSVGLYGMITLLFFIVLLFTRSRSGFFGFVVMDAVFWGLIVMPDLIRHPSSSQNSGFRLGGRNDMRIAGILHVLFALIVFINGTGSAGFDKYVTFNGWLDTFNKVTIQKNDKTPDTATPSAAASGPALEVGGTESGVIRKYVWQAAVNAWSSTVKTQLIGTGTETFAFAFYQFRPVAHNLTSEWDFLYNKAHNEYLNYLATTGLFGLGSYLLLLGSFIWWFTVKIRRSWDLTRELLPMRSALFTGWVSILITNFFGFSVVLLQLFLFLFPAIIIASEPENVRSAVRPVRLPAWLRWIVVFGGLLLIARIASFWYADTLYARGYRLIRSGMFGAAIPAFTRAISVNSDEPSYHDELGSAYATLAVAAFEGSNATQAAQLATLAVGESVKAITTSPKNVNFYKTRTKVYYTLSALDPTFNAKAVEALQYAITLSPNDPKIYYNLAILLGRGGDSEQAIQYLQKAKTLKPNYRDAYYALWVFFTDEKKPNDARAVLQEYLAQVDPNDKDFLERIQ